MPIIMKKNYNIPGNYTDKEKETLQELIDTFRLRMSDDDMEKNILNSKTKEYSDSRILKFLFTAVDDLNGGFPRTNYTIFQYNEIDNNLILDGAMIWAMIAEGILQLRNQVDYSDSGLSVSMFNKTGLYQGWAGFMLQQYMMDKKQMKASVLPKSANAGFVGIGSEFGYDGW